MLIHLIIPKEKITNMWLNTMAKKIHFGSAKTEDYITHKDKDRRQKYLNKAKKIKDKDGRLTYKLPFYPNYWSVNLLN